MGERTEKSLDDLAEPGFPHSGTNLRAVGNAVPHETDPEHPQGEERSTGVLDPSVP